MRWSRRSTRPGILGLTTNTGFLRALVASEEFRLATIDTAWLDTARSSRPAPRYPGLRGVDPGDAGRGPGQRAPVPVRRLAAGRYAVPTVVELDETVLVDRAAVTVGEHEVRQISAETTSPC